MARWLWCRFLDIAIEEISYYCILYCIKRRQAAVGYIGVAVLMFHYNRENRFDIHLIDRKRIVNGITNKRRLAPDGFVLNDYPDV